MKTDTTIGKFTLVRKLGEGGMGEVWLAEDAELGRRVALKFIKHEDLEQIARFRREAQLVARLNHPGIAAIYEAGDGHIAMQFVEGATLKDLPGNDHRTAARAIRDAALAVHYAHECGVIHRDLKPANIMFETPKATARLTNAPRSLRVYVMDFGLAKQIDTRSSLSVSGTIVGTPSYMPPEQADGRAKDIGPQSDIYSLGATLYDLLAGRPPHQGLGVYDTLKKVVEEEPTPLAKANPKVDPDLAVIVHKALAKEPARRYRTAAALAEDLDRWMNGEPISARPPSIPEKVLKFSRKNRVAVMTGSFALLLVSIALGWSITSHIGKQRSEIEKLRAETRAKDAELEGKRISEEKRRIELETRERELVRLRLREDIDRAYELSMKGKHDESERMCDDLLKRQAEPDAVYSIKAQNCVARGQYEEAAACYTKVWEKRGDYSTAWAIAACYMNVRSYREAAKWYERGWSKAVNVPEGLNYSLCLAQLGRFDDALKVIGDCRAADENQVFKAALDDRERRIRDMK